MQLPRGTDAAASRRAGQLGEFLVDAQVFGYLLTHAGVRSGLPEVWEWATAAGLGVD